MEAPPEKPARLMSLDAYRGLIMLTLVGGAFGIREVAAKLKDSPFWDFLGDQMGHRFMAGCTYWDLIQPSFMFMVGVAVPYSLASRRAKGETTGKIVGHTIYRCLMLILLGVFLSSNSSSVKQTSWTFDNVLTQIGLGYGFLCLFAGRGLKVQFAGLAAILAGYWLFFALWPAPPPDFDYGSIIKDNRFLPQFTGFFSHWNVYTNPAAAFDRWFLNLFPRPQRVDFVGYHTLNFIPSMGTMLLGLMAGELLRGPREAWQKCARLYAAGLACLAIGLVLGCTACPLVKRLWTPSFAVYCSGWTFLMLATFYLLIDIRGYTRWAFLFVVAGTNSIALYCLMWSRGWINRNLKVHFGKALYETTYGPIFEQLSILLVLWLICFWMYRKKVFIKV